MLPTTMAGVSTVSAAVTNAFTGMISSVGETSLARVVSAADATANNLIDGMTLPMTEKVVEARGYKFRDNGTLGSIPELTPQQLQVTQTSTDKRIMNVQRDAVGFLNRACRTSDALNRKHPTFEEEGAVHLRLTFPVPAKAKIGGFEHIALMVDKHTSSPGLAENTADASTIGPLSKYKRSKKPKSRPERPTYYESEGMLSASGALSPRDPPGNHGKLYRTRCHDLNLDTDLRDPSGSEALSQEAFDRWVDGECTSDDSDGDIDPGGETPRFPASSLGILGNALQAREKIDKMRGAVKYDDDRAKTPCNFCKWVDFGKAQGYLDALMRVANPSGARDLYVLDVIFPTALLTTCMETADSLVVDEKLAKNLNLQKAQRKLKRIVSGKVDQATFNYLETITHLVCMALILDLGQTGKNHCDIFAYSGEQPIFKDFFASSNLEQAAEELQDAKKEAGHPVEGIVYSVPAPEVTGSLSETLVMYETPQLGDYELVEKKNVVGAVQIGVDLMGKPSPNDHKNPLNFVFAVYRHFGDSTTVVAKGTPFEYAINIDRSEKSKLSPEHERVWEDLIDDHCRDFEKMLTDMGQRFDFDFMNDGKPNSYTTEGYEQWVAEQIQDESFFSCDNAMCELLANTKATKGHMQQLRATAQCKKGEDSSRSRAVISPGVAGNEGLHQARTSPMIKALEALHAIRYNHTNLKGLTEETKRIRFAEFLRAVPKGAFVFGTDKSKNDSCFREAVWKKCIKYLAKMSDIFVDHVATRPYVYSPNENHTSESFPKGSLDLKFWVIKLTPLLAILLSGIGPTSFLNRVESSVENGTTVLVIQGEEAYAKWREAERNAVASAHPAWNLHELPHVAEIVEYTPLTPHMVTDTSIACDKLKDEQIESYHMGLNEGDDQTHVAIPPKTEEWKNLGAKDFVMKYSSEMSKATNFIFEAALTADDTDMIGRNSIFEMLSAWVGLPHGRSDAYEVAVIVPKVLKAIRKLAHCTISSQHTLIYDEHTKEAIDVERDAKYWSLGLTKFFALAIINQESLGVRGLFLAHGDYCYKQLENLIGKRNAYSHETVYGDRDPEKRRIEEAASTTFEHCGVMRVHAHEVLSKVNKERVTRVCCTAWRSELPDLARVPKENIIAALLEFDSIAMTLEITEQHVADPMLLWQELDIGCLLGPLVMHATTNHKKVAAMFRSTNVLADSEETVLLARKYASAKSTGSADKDGRPDKAAETQQGKKGKGKAKGKGKGTGKGKDASHAKGKGKGKGKHVFPKPSWKQGATNDKWWRVGRR